MLVPPNLRYSGTLARGVVVVNHLLQRGRRLGLDVFERCGTTCLWISSAWPRPMSAAWARFVIRMLMEAEAEYRFFFNPDPIHEPRPRRVRGDDDRHAVVGLATTEMVTVIRNEHNGYVDTRIDRLIDVMHALIDDPALAREWGRNARRDALARFGIPRFVQDWNRAFDDVVRAGEGELVLTPRASAYVQPATSSIDLLEALIETS